MRIERISNEVYIKEIYEGDIINGTLTIPYGVTILANPDDSKLFLDNTRELIKSVIIPDSVTSIREWTFADCSSLTNIYVDKNNSNYCDIDGVLFNKRKTELICYPKGNTRTYYEIPDSVISIGNGAFFDCTLLTSVTIPNSVVSIGGSAFWCCTSLTSIKIPESVTTIGVSAFSNCASLTGITIPDSVTSIGGSAFYKCSSLTSITIPENVTSIGNYAFDGCTSLKNIKVTEHNTVYCDVDGVLFNNDKRKLIKYPIGNQRTAYIIPDGVKSIGIDAFAHCTTIKNLTLPKTIRSIGDGAFMYCSSLFNITIPERVKNIGVSAFNHCTALTSVIIPNSVTSYIEFTFYKCMSLTSITIPDSITIICDNSFDGCDKLTIKCNKNSAAEKYAIENNIPYEIID